MRTYFTLLSDNGYFPKKPDIYQLLTKMCRSVLPSRYWSMTLKSMLPGISSPNTTPVTVTAKTSSDLQLGRLAYSIADTASILGISKRSVHRLLKRGLLRGSKALRKIIIARSEIEKFLTETTEGA